MASTTIVELIDDVDGRKADETVSFALDGRSLEIDLSAANATKLRAAVQPYIDAGRRVGRSGRTTRTAADARSREEMQAIQEWARASGYQVSDRGRVSAEILDAYDKAPNA
jgi:hypothetical protein